MSPSDRVAQLYRQALVSLFVSFYDCQGYGGGILADLHMGSLLSQCSQLQHKFLEIRLKSSLSLVAIPCATFVLINVKFT
jgi:hypothetical protein